MKAKNLILWSFLLLQLWLPSCAAPKGHAEAHDRKVASLVIRHTTPRHVEDRRLLRLIRSQPGTIYDEKTIDADVRTLWESGLVEDVQFSTKPEGDALHLIAAVSTRRGVGPVLFRGNSRYPDQVLWRQISGSYADRIQRAVNVQRDPAKGKPTASKDKRFVSELLPAVCMEVKNFYAKNGFNDVRVRAESWKGGPPTATDFVFTIDEMEAKRRRGIQIQLPPPTHPAAQLLHSPP